MTITQAVRVEAVEIGAIEILDPAVATTREALFFKYAGVDALFIPASFAAHVSLQTNQSTLFV